MNKSMNKSVALGAVVIVALGVVAVHSIGGGGPQSATVAAVAPAAVKPMSPLQIMRRDRETVAEGDLEGAF